MKTQLWAMIAVILASFVGSWGTLLVKMGSEKFSFNIIKQLKNYKMILGYSIYVVSSIFFIIALRGGELSVLYPMVALTYVWVSLFSVRFLKEKMNLTKWAGIIFIVVGVALIGIGS